MNREDFLKETTKIDINLKLGVQGPLLKGTKIKDPQNPMLRC